MFCAFQDDFIIWRCVFSLIRGMETMKGSFHAKENIPPPEKMKIVHENQNYATSNLLKRERNKINKQALFSVPNLILFS